MQPQTLVVSFSCLMLLFCFLTGCSTTNKGPNAAIEDQLEARQHDDTQNLAIESRLRESQELVLVETLETDNETAIRHQDWSFSPSFVLEASPQSALTRVLNAIYREKVDVFCQDFVEKNACKTLFWENEAILSDAYVSCASPVWQKTKLGMMTTLEGVAFYFERQRSGWQLTHVCTQRDDATKIFPKC